MRSPGPRFGWQGEGDSPELPPLLLQSARSAPHGEGRFLSVPRVSGGGRATAGQAGLQCAVPKPGPGPKFPLSSLVTPCPFLPPAQACAPPSAVTHVSARTVCPRRRRFRAGSCPSPGGVAPALNWGQSTLRSSLAPRPSVPLPVPRACLVTGGGGGASSLLCGLRWGVGVDPTKQEDGGLARILTVGPKGKTSSLIPPTALLPSFAPAHSSS